MGNIKNYSILFAVMAIIALLGSLPLTWITIQNATIEVSLEVDGELDDETREEYETLIKDLKEKYNSPSETMTAHVSGLKGKITIGIVLPIWLIVGIGLFGVLLAVLNNFRVFSYSRIWSIIPLTFSSLCVVIIILITIGNPEATIRIGVFVTIMGLVFGFMYAFIGKPGPKTDVELKTFD